ncbi:MAG TPA: hypothetical protein VF432_29610 [Thermoanaerobaculia bacterium]
MASMPRAVAWEEIYDALWPATFVSKTNMAGIVNEQRVTSSGPSVSLW